MVFIFKLILIGYSFFYQYETPLYLGTSSFYSSAVWYMPAIISHSGYKSSITLTGILPYSYKELKHSSISAFFKLKHFYVYSGLKFRNLSGIYTEGTMVVGGVISAKNISASLDVRPILLSLKGEQSIARTTLDASFIIKKAPFFINYALFNLIRSNLNFVESRKSSIGERILLTLNYPKTVFFTLGYEKEGQYETPLLSTEIWFTHGFNVVFGIENNTVEGGIGLRGTHMAVNFRIKSHTIMGPTYISQISFYSE